MESRKLLCDPMVFDDPYAVIDWMSAQISKAVAHERTSDRLDEAHAYVQEYCMPEGWGVNVWHSILDDAIRLRKERLK